jgi:PAS domain S-box-containing protein
MTNVDVVVLQAGRPALNEPYAKFSLDGSPGLCQINKYSGQHAGFTWLDDRGRVWFAEGITIHAKVVAQAGFLPAAPEVHSDGPPYPNRASSQIERAPLFPSELTRRDVNLPPWWSDDKHMAATVLTPASPALSSSPLTVLLVGNQEEDYFLIREILSRKTAGFSAELDHAASLDEARVMLQRKPYGLVLFECGTKDAAAVELLSAFLNGGSTVPFILLTEDADEKSVADIIGARQWNCIGKSELNGANLLRTIQCALSLDAMQREKQSSQDTLRQLSLAVEKSADTVMITTRDGIIQYVNPAFEALTGHASLDVVGKTPRILKSGEHGSEVYQELWKTVLSGNVYRGILVNRKKNGELFCVEQSISPVLDQAGVVTHFIANGRDLTERLRLEAHLLQAQKMDSIGRLAGGVAHDFNNLLTIITSYSELALDAVTPGTPVESKLQEILTAARRATQLTRQLLAFSRKQPRALRVVDLNSVIAEIAPPLRRLIGEDIDLIFSPQSDLKRVRIDPVQIEQILLNLGANGRDAMPQGGRLTIETSNVHLDDNYIQCKHAIVPTGNYALISVTDTGTGISPDHLPHIFEPFYTTKPSGEGTGLGLATVYGIVKQNRGFIWAYSEAGVGSVFKIYLPAMVARGALVEAPDTLLETPIDGSETILLVEDENAVRRAVSEFLSLHGYTVLEAKDGLDALAIAKDYGSTIHLVVSDVVMPNMSGGQLAKELRARRPESKVLFVSGYAGKTLVDHNVAEPGMNLLQKPFSLRQLCGTVRALLSQPQ